MPRARLICLTVEMKRAPIISTVLFINPYSSSDLLLGDSGLLVLRYSRCSVLLLKPDALLILIHIQLIAGSPATNAVDKLPTFAVCRAFSFYSVIAHSVLRLTSGCPCFSMDPLAILARSSRMAATTSTSCEFGLSARRICLLLPRNLWEPILLYQILKPRHFTLTDMLAKKVFDFHPLVKAWGHFATTHLRLGLARHPARFGPYAPATL